MLDNGTFKVPARKRPPRKEPDVVLSASRDHAHARTGQQAPESRRPRGRPLGAKNKPKSLVPQEVATKLLAVVEGYLPKEHTDYLRKVIKDGAVLSTKHELDILLAVLNRNLMFAMLEEMPREIIDPVTKVRTLKAYMPNKDITDRIKAAKEMLSLRNTIDKGEREGEDPDQPLLTIIAGRGVDPSRLRLLVGMDSGRLSLSAGDEPGVLLGDAYRVERPADPVGAVSTSVPE